MNIRIGLLVDDEVIEVNDLVEVEHDEEFKTVGAITDFDQDGISVMENGYDIWIEMETIDSIIKNKI